MQSSPETTPEFFLLRHSLHHPPSHSCLKRKKKEIPLTTNHLVQSTNSSSKHPASQQPIKSTQYERARAQSGQVSPAPNHLPARQQRTCYTCTHIYLYITLYISLPSSLMAREKSGRAQRSGRRSRRARACAREVTHVCRSLYISVYIHVCVCVYMYEYVQKWVRDARSGAAKRRPGRRARARRSLPWTHLPTYACVQVYIWKRENESGKEECAIGHSKGFFFPSV